MQLNCKVIKKWQLPPISSSNPPFQDYPPFLVRFLVLPKVTQFLEGPASLPEQGGSSNYVNDINVDKELVKYRLKKREDFWIKKLKTLQPCGFNA